MAGILYLFVGLAIICDEYFVASLEKISEALQLSDDVAGATFMAAGSSAPELFVSIADNVLRTPRSIGIGTIVGSAIFNILIIIAFTGLLAGQVLQLDWRPLARDVAWYLITIGLLFACVADKFVQWYEAAVMLLFYGGYIYFMRHNRKFLELAARTCPSKPSRKAPPEAIQARPLPRSRTARRGDPSPPPCLARLPEKSQPAPRCGEEAGTPSRPPPSIHSHIVGVHGPAGTRRLGRH